MTQDKLDQEYRDSERQRFTNAFQRNIRDTLGITFSEDALLDTDTTYRLHTQFFRRFRDRDVLKTYWEPKHVVGLNRGIVAGEFPSQQNVLTDDLWTMLRELGVELGARSAVLFYNHERELGAIRIDVTSALRFVPRLWPLVKYDFCLSTDEAHDGLCLEYNQYKDRGVYELSCWGILTPKALR